MYTIDSIHEKFDNYDFKNDPLVFKPDAKYHLLRTRELLVEHSDELNPYYRNRNVCFLKNKIQVLEYYLDMFKESECA